MSLDQLVFVLLVAVMTYVLADTLRTNSQLRSMARELEALVKKGE